MIETLAPQPAVAEASTSAKATAGARAPRWLLPLLLLLFFGSGACALVYQVMWLRLLSLVFGVTVFAAKRENRLPPAYLIPMALMALGYMSAFGSLWLVRIRAEVWRRRAGVLAMQAAGG